MRLLSFACLGCLALSVSAHAQEISETLATPLRATLKSSKKPAALELCVADAITQVGGAIPVPIRSGERDVMILGYGHTPKLIVTLIDVDAGTRVEVRTRSGDMDDRLVGFIKARCAIAD